MMTDSVQRLHAAIEQAREGDPARSRTARLFGGGMPKMAKKLAEEAVEIGIAALQDQRRETILESADLIYNLVALWSAMDIAPDDIWAELDRRERLYGIAEKLPKTRSPDRSKRQRPLKLAIGETRR
ncbi:phosphoribosyl-ATP diphosphatase [Bosea minatitlanensis]|uniref:Phosphoribosyl-ATP pyrophosphatase n=1 Tax=Bosea minatitlanensis TaxID=128782 RepID=A0ABW0F4T0_9HYPH|nr:phosphoribosyl-ATP diphosphatase [Bosea minatitlanensis]MCT4493362.1 phosphoribosyl-ATP diphosphatase [Bosea minatitlanensis]